MRRRAVAALVAALCGGACSAKDPGPPAGGDPLGAVVEDAAPRPRPAEVAHLTLKVVGMT